MTPRNPWRKSRDLVTAVWLTVSIIITAALLFVGIAYAAPQIPQQAIVAVHEEPHA